MLKKFFFGFVPKSPTQMGSLSAKNASKKFSRLGTFKKEKVEILLPHTQYTRNNFYRILSTHRKIFTAYSVRVEYFVPHTQQARKNLENFCSQLYRILSTREIIFTAY